MESVKIRMVMRIMFIALFVAGFAPNMTFAQDSNAVSMNAIKADSIPKWSFYAEADYYIFPADQNILMLVATADRDILHLEARYNYEDRNTASLFGGLNFSFGNQLKLSLTPMAGLVFGSLNGAVPGLETDLSYKIFDLSAQSEYVIDFSGKENDFGYTYLQMGATLLKKLKLGMAAQRTHAYKTDLDLQRGVFMGYGFHTINAAFTWFNPFTTSYFFVATLSINF